MSENIGQPSGENLVENDTSQVVASKENRLEYIDNLRSFLIILVIMHHSAITYGASGSWVYYEMSNRMTTMLLTWFTGINQSFFMALFFMLSGYFIPKSLERKGARAYIKDRLIRLGIPLLIYTFLINYFVWWIVVLAVGGSYVSFLGFMFNSLAEINVSTGPLWFVLTLLLYTLGYIGVYQLRKRKEFNTKSKPNKIVIKSWTIILLSFVLGIGTFVVRIVFPSDYQIPLIEGLGIQLGYTPQYLTFFILGILAAQKKWLEQIEKKHALLSSAISGFFIVGIFIFALTIGVFDNYDGPSLSGGWNWTSFVYSVCEGFLTVNISVTLVYGFRRFFNDQNRVEKFMSANAYTAYIIHPVVVVGTALLLRPVIIYPLLKWVILATIAIPTCFLISALIRKIPRITRILG